MQEVRLEIKAAPAAVTRIVVGRGVLRELGALVRGAASLHLVGDENVASSADWWPSTRRHAGRELDSTLLLPPGERSKSIDFVAAAWEAWIDAGAGRDALVLAVGGGSVTDVAGFAAATFMRGVPWVAVPTTVLAMADAAIGGKTGVNTPRGKNLAGCVHHPLAVLCDVETLRTLPDAEYADGWAEIVKTGVVADAGLLDLLERKADDVRRRREDAVEELIGRCVRAKVAVVGADPTERSRREILNFGHTWAHALEHATSGAASHGRAVAAGLVTESRLAVRLGRLPAGTPRRIDELCRALGIDLTPVTVSREHVLAALAVDKKRRAGALRVALPDGIGRHSPNPGVTIDAADLLDAAGEGG